MTWSAATRRRVTRLVEDVIALDGEVGNPFRAEDSAPCLDTMGIEARKLLPLLRDRKRIRQALPGPSRAEKKARKRETHREETARIRDAVFKRAGGRCEHTVPILNTGAVLRCLRPPTELHHLESGNGKRRQRQTVENCRAYCFECHREAHRASKRPSPPRDGRQDTKGET